MSDLIERLIAEVVSLRERVAHLEAIDVATPAVRVYNSAALSIANNLPTALTFDSERFDTNGIHDTVTNPDRLTCRTAGVYVITGHINWASNASGVRQLYIQFNGSTLIATTQTLSNGVGNLQTISTIWKMVVGDYVQLVGFQNSGGVLNISSNGDYSPEFAMVKVG